MRTGLVIQGPILSPGFGPYRFNSDGEFKRSYIDYDSRENILKLIEMARNKFDFLVIATWKSAESVNFAKKFQNVKNVYIVEIEESETLKRFASESIHKYHQITTALAGVQKLQELGCELVAKVRTDQYLDVRSLHGQLLENSNRISSLGVPYVNLFELDRLVDFYFIGQTETVIEVLSSYMNEPESFTDVHLDYFYKFSKSLTGKATLLNPNLRSGGQQFFQNHAIWSETFYPLKKSLFAGLYWRGEKVNSQVNSWVRWFKSYKLGILNRNQAIFLNLIVFTLVRLSRRITLRPRSYLLFRVNRIRG
jgi:hypothetical protein